MDLLILFLLIATSRISGNKHCIERECISNVSQWCCPYNTTCGNQNTCNDIKQASRQSYCLSGILCFSNSRSWCCGSDQTCGDNYRECNNNKISIISISIIVCTIGSIILVAIFCGCRQYQRLRRANTTQTIHHQSVNQEQQVPIYVLTNDLTTQANSSEQVMTDLNKEESPPTYDAAVASSTTQNQDKI